MQAHRDKYAMAKKDGEVIGPWADPQQFAEMGRKTMIRNPLIKMIPLSTDLQTALAVDEGVRLDLNPNAFAEEVTERERPQPPADNGNLPAEQATGRVIPGHVESPTGREQTTLRSDSSRDAQTNRPAAAGADQPAPATSRQVSTLHALFKGIGWNDRDDRIRACSAITGRAISSTSDLTKAEVSHLIDRLKPISATADPAMALTDLLAELRPDESDPQPPATSDYLQDPEADQDGSDPE
jgi:recombination protein RecT